ncbi:MAG: thiamine pyrophosphate-binding protein [Nitrososphaerales archaeon]
MNVSEIVVQRLADSGIEQSFGIPAQSILDITDAMYRNGSINFVTVRHEQVAASMADGYARVSGIPAVCMAGAGPGSANMVLGVANAYRASVPMVAITANVESKKIGRDSFNEWKQTRIYKSITKHSYRLNNPNLTPNLIDRVIRSTVSGRPGPVHLDIPEDLGYADVKSPSRHHRISLGPSRLAARSGEVKKALEALITSNSPILMVGGGAVWSGAGDSLLRLAELFSIPVVVSMSARGIIPEDHPLCFGPSGRWGFSACNDLVKSADFILSLGFRFGEWATNGWTIVPPDVKIAQVDVEESEIGRHYPAKIGSLADVKTFIEQMLQIVTLDIRKQKKLTRNGLKRLMEKLANQRKSFLSSNSGSPVDPRAIIREVMRFKDEDMILTVGAGKHALFASRALVMEPRSFLKAGEFGPMTFAFPAGLGAKIARPDKTVICLIGDGDFMMTVQDLETAVRENIAIISVVFNDGCYNAERLPRLEGRNVGVEFTNPDFVKLAESFGAVGAHISRPADILPVLKRMAKEQIPAVIDVAIDRDAKL